MTHILKEVGLWIPIAGMARNAQKHSKALQDTHTLKGKDSLGGGGWMMDRSCSLATVSLLKKQKSMRFYVTNALHNRQFNHSLFPFSDNWTVYFPTI